VTNKIVIKNCLFALLFLSLAFWGYINSGTGLAILQALVSSVFLRDLINHLRFISENNRILESLKNYFGSETHNFSNNASFTTKTLLDYETNLAYAKYLGDSKIYNEFNDNFSKKWGEVKKRYGIKKT